MTELERLAQQGKLIPLKPRSKEPKQIGYATKEYDLDDLSGCNVGLMIDEKKVDIDFDWPESRMLAPLLFNDHGPTFGWGRKNEITHLVYAAEIAKGVNFELKDEPGAPKLSGPHGNMILQVRTSAGGEPYHAMIPPSVHPDGDTLEWNFDAVTGETHIAIKETDGKALVKTCAFIAGVSALARFYPAQGGRDEAMLGIVGCMVRAGYEQEQIEVFVRQFCLVVGDNEIDMRVDKAKRTLKRQENGRKFRGIPATAKSLGIPVEWMRKIAVWLGWAKENPEGSGPVVFLSGVVRDVAKQAWHALSEYEVDDDPGVYAYGETLARVDRGRLGVLDASGLKFELNRCASWLAQDGDKWKRTSAPSGCVEDMLSARRAEVTVPELRRVSIVPTFTKDGRILKRRGFDEASGIFIDLEVDVDVPDEPTRQDVRWALRQLWTPIRQFPFEDRSDRVHALAMVLEPYMRDMFGPTPMYFVNKPRAGTGASLFIETSLYPTLGYFPEAQTPPTAKEEMKKTLTACFIEGDRVIYFDNANYLDSGELASALTAEVYAARILGVSKMCRVPVQVQWVGSGNNTQLSSELYRRTVDIRMDAKMANPEDRAATQFRIRNLKEWVREKQAEQVRAACTIIQYWVNQGMPEGDGHKASYETWSKVMSGLFDSIGVTGFLETPEDRRPDDPEGDQVRELVLAMFNAQRGRSDPSGSHYDEDNGWQNDVDWTKPYKASDVVLLVNAGKADIDFGFKDPARVVGDLLRHNLGVPFDFDTAKGGRIALTIEKSRYQGTTRWFIKDERL